MIECRAVSVHVGSFDLHAISLIVPDGAYAVLTGPSASGKTTLLELLAGAIGPTHGTVLLDGRDVRELPLERRDIGLVHQHGYLFPHLTVRENVEYGARNADGATELMHRFGVAHLAGRGVVDLSGGERQIVAICRALATRPRILLMDEPYSALDRARREAVRAEVARLHHDWQLTTLHVTHDDGEAVAVATVRLRIKDGRIENAMGAGQPLA